MSNLPSGWTTVAIGDLCRLINGRAFKPTDWTPTGLPIVRIQNLNNEEAPFNRFSGEVDERFLIDSGDLLFAWSGTPGTSFGAHIWNRGKAILNQHIFRVLFDPSVVEKRFLRLAINERLDHLISMAHGGAGLAHVTKPMFEGTRVLLPPRPEQDRIVAEVEKQNTRLDAGVAALKRVQAQLKRYRASVLKAACEGRLVPTEAELARREKRDYEPADKLLARILTERRARWEADQLAKIKAAGKPPKDDMWKAKYVEPLPPEVTNRTALPVGWTWASIAELAEVVRGGSPRPAGDPRYFGGSIPWITVGALTADQSPYLLSVASTVTEEGKERSRFIQAGTLLLTNSGATLGVPKITNIGGCINDGIAALLGVDGVLKLYLYYFLLTRTDALRNIDQGAAQPNLNTSIIKAIAVPLPPHAEQKRIVADIESRLSVYAANGQTVAACLVRAVRLRQALLSKAFDGALVAQDPNDEPAAKLLERISAAKTNEPRAKHDQAKRASPVSKMKATR